MVFNKINIFREYMKSNIHVQFTIYKNKQYFKNIEDLNENNPKKKNQINNK